MSRRPMAEREAAVEAGVDVVLHPGRERLDLLLEIGAGYAFRNQTGPLVLRGRGVLGTLGERDERPGRHERGGAAR